jgi:hypothetical protein
VPAVREFLADLVQSVAKFIVFAHHQKVPLSDFSALPCAKHDCKIFYR